VERARQGLFEGGELRHEDPPSSNGSAARLLATEEACRRPCMTVEGMAASKVEARLEAVDFERAGEQQRVSGDPGSAVNGGGMLRKSYRDIRNFLMYALTQGVNEHPPLSRTLREPANLGFLDRRNRQEAGS
jgi:hypothetical protein